MQAEDFIDWMNAVERVFEYKDVPKDKKVILISTRLQGRASAWWEQLRRSRARLGKAKITEWPKMKKKLEEQFLPFNYRQSLYQRLHSLRQGVRSVEAYTEEFHMLVVQNDLGESEDQLVSRYLSGLRQGL